MSAGSALKTSVFVTGGEEDDHSDRLNGKLAMGQGI